MIFKRLWKFLNKKSVFVDISGADYDIKVDGVFVCTPTTGVFDVGSLYQAENKKKLAVEILGFPNDINQEEIKDWKFEVKIDDQKSSFMKVLAISAIFDIENPTIHLAFILGKIPFCRAKKWLGLI